MKKQLVTLNINGEDMDLRIALLTFSLTYSERKQVLLVQRRAAVRVTAALVQLLSMVRQYYLA